MKIVDANGSPGKIEIKNGIENKTGSVDCAKFFTLCKDCNKDMLYSGGSNTEQVRYSDGS